MSRKKSGSLRNIKAATFLLILPFFFLSVLSAEENVPDLPRFFLNDKSAALTVQDLSGFGTRPLRLLVERNNKVHQEELIQVYALGAAEGDEIKVLLSVPVPGMPLRSWWPSWEPRSCCHRLGFNP